MFCQCIHPTPPKKPQLIWIMTSFPMKYLLYIYNVHATEHLLVSFFTWGAEHAASSIDGLEVCCPAECPDCSISAWVPEISDPRKQVDFTWWIFDVSLPVSKNYISCLQAEKHHLQVINLLGVHSMFSVCCTSLVRCLEKGMNQNSVKVRVGIDISAIPYGSPLLSSMEP